MARVTMKAEVEITVETPYPASWKAEGLAADLRDWLPVPLEEHYGNVITTTVTPIEE